MSIYQKRRFALLGGCAVFSLMAVLGSPAMAGCNSGNVANTHLLSSADCQAAAPAAGATAVGFQASATGASSPRRSAILLLRIPVT